MALGNPEAIWYSVASIPLESASHIQDVSSKPEAELPLLAVIVLSSLEESEEIVSLYESIVISLFCRKLFSGTAGRLSSLCMCWAYSLSGSDLISNGFSFF